jgi:hypothetical protein
LAQTRQYRQQEMAASRQQMAHQAQETQLTGIQVQQAQQGLQDQQTLRTMLPQMMNDPQFQTPDGQFDWTKGLNGLAAKVSPATALGLQKTILDNQKAHADAAKLSADADKAAQEATDKRREADRNGWDALANDAQNWIDHGRNPAVLDAKLMHVEQMYPNLKPHINQLRQQLQADPNSANAVMDQMAQNLSAGGLQARAELAKTTAAQTETEQRTAGLQAGLEQTQRTQAAPQLVQASSQEAYEQMLSKLPPSVAAAFPKTFNRAAILNVGMTPEQITTAEGKTATLTEEQRHHKADEASTVFENQLKANKNAREQQQFNQTFGQGLNEQGQPMVNPTAAAIASYQIPPPSARSLAAPAGQMLMRQVLASNPEYDATQFPNRQKTRIAWTSGTQGQQINAMNTAIGHLDQMSDAVAALGNTDTRIVNEARNWLRTSFGDPAVTNFNTLKTALTGELASVLKRTGATDSEIKQVESTVAAQNSPAQLAGYIKTNIPIMGSKLSALNYQYHQAMGEKDPFQALSPESKGVLQKYGFDPNNPRLQSGAGAAPGKTASKSQIAEYAKKKGIPEQQATQEFLGAGYKLQ